MNNTTRKQAADILLYEYGLLEKLKTIGCPHIVGSYRSVTGDIRTCFLAG